MPAQEPNAQAAVWPAYAAREAVLRDLERAIAATPEALDTRYYYASFLRDHGRLGDAIAVFEDVLAAAPDHVDTMLALGVTLSRCGRRLEARAHFEHAVERNPHHAGALVNLANALSYDEPARSSTLFGAALAVDPACAPAHRGLCSLAAAAGDAESAARHRAAGYASGPFARRLFAGPAMPIAAIALMSTDGGNTPLETLLDERTFLVHELFVETYAGEPVPPHQLVVNAIADADRSPAALELAERITHAMNPPVVNAPRRVAVTGRVANARRMAALSDIVVPQPHTVARDELANVALPAIVRVPGMHMGRGMLRIDDAAALAAAQPALPDRNDLLAIPYVETRSPDGAWRKYRVIIAGSNLYPLHLAIAHRWDVHYFSSAMHERADYRAEEAAFLNDPAGTIGTRAWRALERIRDLLGLDYAGIDFALDDDGRAVIFEANAAMAVIPPGDDERFAYRRAAVDAVTSALRDVLLRRAA